MDRQESLFIGCVTGTRKPRSGSCRKRRSGPHPFVTSVYADDALSPLASSPSSSSSYGKVLQHENGHCLVQSFGGRLEQANGLMIDSLSSIGNGITQDRDNCGLLQPSKDFEGYNQSARMGDGEIKHEWKIFQRSDRRRLPKSDLNNSSWHNVRDSSGGCVKDTSIPETVYDRSLDYERQKTWKEKSSPPMDLIYHNNGDLSSKDSDQVANKDQPTRARASSNQSQRHRGHLSSKDRGLQDSSSASVDYVNKGSMPEDRHKFRRCSYGSRGSGRKVREIPSIPCEKSSQGSQASTKLELKVGGIINAVHPTQGRQADASGHNNQGKRMSYKGTGSSLRNTSSTPESFKRRQRLILQANSDDEDAVISTRSMEESLGKDDTVSDFMNAQAYFEPADVHKEESAGKLCSGTCKSLEASQPLPAVRKSSRVPKKRIFDGDEDVELEPKRRRRKRIGHDSEDDQNHVEEEHENDMAHGLEVESICESQPRQKRQRKRRDEPDTPELDGKKGLPLTARQRALKSSKEGGDSEAVASVVEFPDGLTHVLPKKQKENLSEAEQAVKKEEAARKRRQQIEKNAKEIQAVAIQKILGQDSTRKKREEKLQKQRKEIEQEKQAAAMIPAINSIRWVMGPSGNVVSFSQDLDLPKIFSGPCSYPQERERCAAPFCNNAYKYRDSKTLLPLCSLQCYKAVQNPPSIASAF